MGETSFSLIDLDFEDFKQKRRKNGKSDGIPVWNLSDVGFNSDKQYTKTVKLICDYEQAIKTKEWIVEKLLDRRIFTRSNCINCPGVT